MEILKQQQKIRERTADPDECKKLCDQAYATITLQVECKKLELSEVKFQIGKVLYDVRDAHRRANNQPARKPPQKKAKKDT